MKKAILATLIPTTISIMLVTFFTHANTNAIVEISDEQLTSITTHCPIIKDNLRTIQYEDSRVRDHLGNYYRDLLSDFIKPLNIVLINNNIPNTSFTENLSSFVSTHSKFENDYIKYQQELEDLVSIDCSAEPARFYNKLVSAREARAKVANDVSTLRSLINTQIKLVNDLKGAL